MVLSVVLSLDEVTDDVVRYIEQTGGKPPILGTIAIGGGPSGASPLGDQAHA